MKKVFALVTNIIFLSSFCSAQSISKKELVKHITFLASDSLYGRGAGSAAEIKAADYIAQVFEKNKLQYVPGKFTYFQNFKFKVKKNPHSQDSSDAVERYCKNVVGYLDNNSKQTIVIGAHYDHLGLGYDHNSLDPNPEGKIHNGADDNASGTAGVLELVRVFSKAKHKLSFNIIFCLFSGEELGLAGSKKFVESNQMDSTNIKYMFNLDMIGRMNDSSKALLVMGFGTSPQWGEILPGCNKGFHLVYDSAGIGPSDYASFYLENIPVLGFFTGQHADYHKPSDDIDKINFKDEKKVLEFITRIIYETEKYPNINFSKTRNKESERTKLKVSLGVMPDYIYEGKGLRLDGVSDDKPASRAGLIKGDVIIKLNEVDINNIQDYMKVLSTLKKGETIKVTVLRGKETLVMEVLL